MKQHSTNEQMILFEHKYASNQLILQKEKGSPGQLRAALSYWLHSLLSSLSCIPERKNEGLA